MHFKQFCRLIFVKEWEYFCVIRRKSVKNSYKKDTKQKTKRIQSLPVKAPQKEQLHRQKTLSPSSLTGTDFVSSR